MSNIYEPQLMYFLAFFASFCFVALKAFQQLSVSGKHYLLIMPVSLMMAVMEVWTITVISKHGWGWLVFWIGFGSGSGAMLGMWIHSRFITKEKR